MVNSKIRVGVIGLGYLGKFHFEKYSSNKSVKLTSIVDIDKKNLDLVNSKEIYKSTSYKDIIGKVDAVSIVTPTITHFSIAKFFLDNKVHVLLEKPMTESVTQAKKLNEIAKKTKRILQIGHLEQFNPAIRKLKSLLNEPEFIEVHRLCKFNPRAIDVDVVLDLMIHDIDIVLSLINKNIKTENILKTDIEYLHLLPSDIDLVGAEVEMVDIEERDLRMKYFIDKIKNGEFDKIDNPIKNAPHTDLELASNEWKHKYSREDAAYPSKFLKSNKFWPPVSRVDNVYGDKNLFCTCPSMDEFKEDAA